MLSSSMAISEQVLAILEDIAEYDDIRQDLDVRLYDEHVLDSLKTVELIIALGEAFGVEIAPTSFEPEQWATPRRIIAYIEEALQERAVHT
jgi:D-alanine--poly(phosphoribitol) ligase subunit 2